MGPYPRRLVSPERPHITPLFGTSSPPKGISGMPRRLAYKMSENDIRHFMLLLLADRVNVVEGIGEDLMKEGACAECSRRNGHQGRVGA